MPLASASGRRDSPSGGVSGSLAAASVRMHTQDGNNKNVLEALKETAAGKLGSARDVASARQWSGRPEEVVHGILAFSRINPPTELLARVPKALVYAWCALARFDNPLRPCFYCSTGEADLQQPHMACPLLPRWHGDRFGMAVLPPDLAMHEWSDWLFLELGRGGESAIRAAVVFDAALHSFDSLLQGSRSRPTAARGSPQRGTQASWPAPATGCPHPARSYGKATHFWRHSEGDCRPSGEYPSRGWENAPASFHPLSCPRVAADRTSALLFLWRNKLGGTSMCIYDDGQVAWRAA